MPGWPSKQFSIFVYIYTHLNLQNSFKLYDDFNWNYGQYIFM